MPPIAQYVWNGVVTGGILALPAVAFSLLWQLLKFPNFAVSTYLTVGAYAALALNQGLAVGEQRNQFLQAFGSAELAEQIRRRPPDFPVGRVHQLPHGLASPRAEAEQDVAKPAAGAGILVRGEYLGKLGNDRRPNRMIERLEPFVRGIVCSSQVR